MLSRLLSITSATRSQRSVPDRRAIGKCGIASLSTTQLRASTWSKCTTAVSDMPSIVRQLPLNQAYLQLHHHHLSLNSRRMFSATTTTSAYDSYINEAAAVLIHQKLRDCAELTSESLSDPSKRVMMPWPSLLKPQSERILLSTESKMDVVGREFFKDLYQHVITNRRCVCVNVMGTKGIGKSHRLAALAGLLLKQRHRVVYLPDCGKSYLYLEDDLRDALLVAFGDNDSQTIREEIARLETLEQIAKFCRKMPRETFIFILDQFNCIQEDSISNANNKQVARDFLRQLIHRHVSVLGFSANNHTTRMVAYQQREEFDFCIFGGLTEAEFDVWCESNKYVFEGLNSTQREECISELCYATGRNPLLLRSFLKHFESFRGTFDVSIKAEEMFTSMLQDALQIFSDQATDEMNTFIDSVPAKNLPAVRNAFLGCMSNIRVRKSNPSQYDHRHMFLVPLVSRELSASFISSPFVRKDWQRCSSLKGVGFFVSGIALEAASEIVRTNLNALKYLLDDGYIRRTILASSWNRSVLGWHVEPIVLAGLEFEGLDGIRVEQVKRFDDLSPDELKKSISSAFPNTLYIPTSHYHPQVDAYLVAYKHVPAKSSSVNKLAMSSSENEPTTSSISKNRLVKKPTMSSTFKNQKRVNQVLDCVEIHFIQISVGEVDQNKLEKTRGVLNPSQFALWRNLVPSQPSGLKVKYVLHWIVRKDQVRNIESSFDTFRRSLDTTALQSNESIVEKVTTLDSIHAQFALLNEKI